MQLQNISIKKNKNQSLGLHASNTNILSVEQIQELFKDRFRAVTRFYAFFHIGFVSCAFVQVLSLLLFFSFFTKSNWSAFAIASLFLTGFTYFVLHFYFQAKKPQQLLEIRHELQEDLKELLKTNGEEELNESLPKLFSTIADSLNQLESHCYPIKNTFQTLKPIIEKFSIWLHWKDVHKMRELLLLSTINETVRLVKRAPSELEAHAKLASAYISLANIYMDPRKKEADTLPAWISPEYQSEAMLDKFDSACNRAIEELKIIKEKAPDNSWTHMMLANIYHDKNLPELEIQEYEALISLHPEDTKILFRLGVLYFSQGRNSLGLKVYTHLKEKDEPLSENLITYYDSFQFHDLSIEMLS